MQCVSIECLQDVVVCLPAITAPVLALSSLVFPSSSSFISVSESGSTGRELGCFDLGRGLVHLGGSAGGFLGSERVLRGLGGGARCALLLRPEFGLARDA
jgi:hypothetical protein